MREKPFCIRRALLPLVTAALALPIVTVVLLAAARLLVAMDDEAGAGVLERLSLAAGLLWALVLIGLVVVQALHALAPPPPPPAHDEPLE